MSTLTDTLDRARLVVTICHKGLKLSHGAAALLRSAGFAAKALSGGTEAWRAAASPTLILDACPTLGTPWVLPAKRDRRAVLSAWIIWRWFDEDATLLWVPADHVSDIATHFGGQAWDGTGELASVCKALGLTDLDLLAHIDALETGHKQGTAWIDMLPNLHETDEELAKAALPLLDAAWLAHRQLPGQDHI